MNVDFQTSDAVAPGLAVVRDAELSGDVVFSGLRVKCLQIVAAATSGITTLLNLDDLPAGIDPAEARAVADVNLHNSLVDAALVARARDARLGVWVFIVGDEQRFAELIDMGVTSLTTNWPERVHSVVRSRSSPGTRDSCG